MSRGKTSNKRVKKVLVRVSIFFNDALEDLFGWLGNRGGGAFIDGKLCFGCAFFFALLWRVI